MTSSKEKFEILFERSWPATGLAARISRIDRKRLSWEYRELRRRAPKRWSRGKRYFTGHDGCLVGKSNRFEEHLAIALWRMEGSWPRPGKGRLRLLDYQLPLKAQQRDPGIGKVDLIGVTDCGRLIVIELKVKPEEDTDRGESPAVALMEGLRYAAIIDANRTEIAQEVKCLFDTEVSEEPPIVQVLAPKAWWHGWLDLADSTRTKVGDWEREFARLACDVEEGLGIVVECMALDDLKRGEIYDGPDCRKPRIDRTLALYPVRLDAEPPIGPALPPQRSGA